MAKMQVHHWYRFKDRGEEYIGQYIGRQGGFECCVCGKGCKAHTFNVWYDKYNYETWGFGDNHLPQIIEDLNKHEQVIVGE